MEKVKISRGFRLFALCIAPELFTEGGDPAFFTARGSVSRVIDKDYRCPVGVMLFNHSEVDFTVKPDNRVVQMIVQVIAKPEVAEVEDLDTITLGEGGFGCTNV
ncbi:hypothetical protein VPH35_140552 [Triticum aestivum]